ncbi:TnsA endonuclease N-terminal domain-containing protein [Idiomarina sp. UBA4520]|uniref:TnsA endonuclease N-terminal domain-containing protein n=1 Tax=Idiomarina sp. UBA4520 TaxID=1946647 RepID=UPI000C4F84F9|nr:MULTISPECIES: TnsA endonuclease N-terminal domain-containing protein [unclassified Idiomarina]MBF38323.1 heteromeric transposase endonuclease subunit TnsA [Idiomarinaceae bacterium]
MGRYRKLESLDDFSRALRNKYGLGNGSDYKPWLRVQDVRSYGNSGKIYGLKTQREHHILSENESCFFYLAEFNDSVIDIREQFPLLPLDLSVRISKVLGVAHPTVPKTKSLSVMTTDFVLSCSDGERVWYEAISVKPREELKSMRSAQKLEIERHWWQLLGVPFHVFVKNEKNHIISQNIQWITSAVRRGETVEASALELALSNLSPQKYFLKELCKEMSRHANTSPENFLNIIKYLLSFKLITADLTKPISSTGILDITNVSEDKEALKYAC